MSEQQVEIGSEKDFIELRKLLLGDLIKQLEELRRRLDDPNLRSEEVSKVLAQALSLSIKHDRRVQNALQPIVEQSLRISVEKDPELLAGTLFPIIGQAVRKSVTHSIQHLLDSLNSIFSDGFSLKRWRWRIEALRSGKTFGEIALARSLAYCVEHVYLIHRKTGLLLAESNKNSDILQDADLIVGMLTALQDFVRDSFATNKQDDLEVLHIGEFKVWLLHGPLAILAVVVRGQLPRELELRFAEKIEHIHQNFQGHLIAFEASGQPIFEIAAGLNDCLLSSTATPASSSYTKFKIAAGILFAAIFIGFFVYARQEVRWQNYLSALRQEPGIAVIEERHNWTSFSLIGLRDPMASDPQMLLAKFHLSQERVSERWEEYLSLDPHLADVRRLDTEKNDLNKMVIRFELNSTIIPLDQLPLVDTVSDQIRELSLSASSQNKKIRVKVLGHADPTGTESHNAELSQQRAETMVRLLAARGVDAKILLPVGLGDKMPERNGADLYEQNLDRRVTFVVIPDGSE
ncbi:OmpA family protein [Edaphobacter dinghuensis]|uniref:OmpA-like domain-containing protein n=1 Tax=Edaphobacter dinghuensis TaxID=1560005 RepID=A0A917M2E7_9BACT|nr:OmpA family protein [Edaphobacter dinghuensis]GGG74899.1 hypothetical protein GCM10011585_17060 [Edaphobacter dinghuensis]